MTTIVEIVQIIIAFMNCEFYEKLPLICSRLLQTLYRHTLQM